jgi:O-antigen/teichoic acid export membrane protein
MSQTDQALQVTIHRAVFERPVDVKGARGKAAAASAVRGSTMAIAGGLISQAFKAAVMIFVARGFGLGDFGSFSFANSINAFLAIVAQFGLPVYGARVVAQSGRLEKGLLKAITEARFLLAISGMTVTLTLLHFSPGVTRSECYLVAGFGLSNVALSGFGDWAFQGMGRLNLWAALNVTWQGLWLIITVAVAHAHYSVAVISFGYAVAALAAGMLGWSWLWRFWESSPNATPHADYSVRSVVAAAANLGTATLLMTVLGWLDTIVVRVVRGQQAAGIYAAGNRVSLALCMLAGFYVLGAFPKLSYAAMSSSGEYSDHFQRALEDLTLLFLPGALWGVLYTQQIILLLFKKPEYLDAVPVFRMFLVFLLLNVITNLFGMGGLVAHKRDDAYRRGMAISAVVLVILCPILTFRWGILGAAIAALLCQSLNLILFIIDSKDMVRPHYSRAFSLPAIMAMIPIMCATIFHVGFWASAAILVLVYLAGAVCRTPILRPSVN